MKAGWQIKTLGEVSKFEGGSQPPKSEFVYEDKKGYIRFIQIRDFSEKERITFIPESKKNRCCLEDDILIGRYGASVGKILTGKKGAYNVALMKTIPNLHIVSREWFYYYLVSFEFQNRLLNIASRSAQDGFSKDDISDFDFPVPPLPEQRRIVAILDEAFAGIAAAKEKAEQNLKNAKEVFEGYILNIFSDIQERNGTRRLEEICGFQNGFAFKSKLFRDNGLPILRISNIQNNKVDTDKIVFFNIDDYKENLDKYKVNKNDLLIAMSGGTTGKIGFNTIDKIFYLNQRVGKFEPKKCLSKRYLFYFLSTRVEENLRISLGSAQPNLSTEQIKNFKIPFPSIQQQQIIVDNIDDITAETSRLESLYQQKLSNLEELKKSLLQQAFSGAL